MSTKPIVGKDKNGAVELAETTRHQASWPRKSVADVCELIIDCVNKTAPTVVDPTPFKMIRTTNVRSGWIDVTNVKYVTKETFEKWTRRGKPKPGDVILTREAPLGEVGLLRSGEHVFLGQRLVMYRADPDKLDNRFLLYSFLSDDLQGQIRSLGSGATVEHMRVPDCEKLTLRVPPLSVQRRIASTLSAYDDLIENNTRRIAILEEMAQRLYREWFVHFRFPGHEHVKMVDSPMGLIPEGWEVCQLHDVIELVYGKALKSTDRIDGVVPVYGSSGIVGYHNRSLVPGPGIIVGRKGNVGSVHWANEAFFPIDTVYYVKTGLSLYYIYYNLKEQNFINNDAAVPGLSRAQAYLLPILVPRAEMLEAFKRFIQPVFAQIRNLDGRNANLRRTRDLLLPKLVSGEVDVEHLDIDIGVADS